MILFGLGKCWSKRFHKILVFPDGAAGHGLAARFFLRIALPAFGTRPVTIHACHSTHAKIPHLASLHALPFLQNWFSYVVEWRQTVIFDERVEYRIDLRYNESDLKSLCEKTFIVIFSENSGSLTPNSLAHFKRSCKSMNDSFSFLWTKTSRYLLHGW